MASDTLVLVNPGCNYGTGRSRWEGVRPEVLRRLAEPLVEYIHAPDRIGGQVAESFSRGVRFFVAAGGDGTVNLLLNAIMAIPEHDRCVIGAVGLGSSNDFHKPFDETVFLGKAPVRIDRTNAVQTDVIRVDYRNGNSRANSCCCLLNASIGITAEANAFFNSRTRFIRALQRLWVEAAIFATALRGVIGFRDVPCELSFDDGQEMRFGVSNLGILKRHHFAGSLCYDTPVAPDSGTLAVNLCHDLSLFERVRVLVSLSKGRFQGLPKTRCCLAGSLSVRSERSFALEVDGEVVRAREVRFSVVPKAVQVCQ